jgi:hypothetical protein
VDRTALRLGTGPRAALAFTVTQDFEGDHFTFFKYPQADIEQLYGTVVQEMAVYDTLEAHVAEQVGRGHTVLVEVDSYYLPDTRATAYRRGHVKTTIAVDRIDTAAQRLSYYHSVGYYTAEGEDYRGLLRLDPALRDNGDVLFPYAECAKRVRTPLQGAALANAVAVQMRRHLGRRPAHNPYRAGARRSAIRSATCWRVAMRTFITMDSTCRASSARTSRCWATA